MKGILDVEIKKNVLFLTHLDQNEELFYLRWLLSAFMSLFDFMKSRPHSKRQARFAPFPP
jgi:hypothetical protein